MLSVERLFFNVSLGNRPLLLLAVLLMLVGVQFISMGLMAEVQVRTYYESQNKPIYRIRRVVRQDDRGEGGTTGASR